MATRINTPSMACAAYHDAELLSRNSVIWWGPSLSHATTVHASQTRNGTPSRARPWTQVRRGAVARGVVGLSATSRFCKTLIGKTLQGFDRFARAVPRADDHAVHALRGEAGHLLGVDRWGGRPPSGDGSGRDRNLERDRAAGFALGPAQAGDHGGRALRAVLHPQPTVTEPRRPTQSRGGLAADVEARPQRAAHFEGLVHAAAPAGKVDSRGAE